MVGLVIVLSILLLIVSLVCMALNKRNRAQVQTISWLMDNYDKLDDGRAEVEENYEAEYRSLNEKIAAQDVTIAMRDKTIAELVEEVNHHREFCLPLVGQEWPTLLKPDGSPRDPEDPTANG